MLKNPSYIFSVIAMTNICFIVTGIQYWVTYYSLNVLNAEKNKVYLLVTATILSGPVVGALIGGLITTKYLGGYTNKHAISLCFGVFLLLICASIPSPYTDNLYLFFALVWFQLCFGGFIEPSLTGILLNTVNKFERPVASSFAILFYNVFGCIPAPYFYGLIADATAEIVDGSNISKVPMKSMMYSSLIGGTSLFLAIVLRRYSQANDFKRFQNSMIATHTDMTREQVVEMLKEDEEYELNKSFNQTTYLIGRDQNQIANEN